MFSASRTWPSWKPIASAYLRRVRADADAAAVARGFVVAEASISGGNAEDLAHYKPTYDRVVQACDDAQGHVNSHGNVIDWFSGSLANAAFMGYHTADVELVELLTDDQIRGKVPQILALAKAYLPADDPQRTAFERRWQPFVAASAGAPRQPAPVAPQQPAPSPASKRRFLRRKPPAAPPQQPLQPHPAQPQPAVGPQSPPPPPGAASVVTPGDRAQFAATLGIIYLFTDLAQLRVRQFRSVLLGTTTFLVVLLISLALAGGFAPSAIAMCGPGPGTNVTAPTGSSATPTPSPSANPAGPGSSPSTSAPTATPTPSPTPGTSTTVVVPAQVCASGKSHPTGPDVLLVEVFGLVGGAIAGAIALSGLGLAGTRYSLSVAQAALKVSLGGMFGFLGIIFLQAGLVTFLQLKSQAQILSYAVIFGYSQQLLTRLIDKQATSLASDASPTTPAPTASRSSGS